MGWIGSFYNEMSHIAFWILDAAIGFAGALIAWLIRRPLARRLGIQQERLIERNCRKVSAVTASEAAMVDRSEIAEDGLKAALKAEHALEPGGNLRKSWEALLDEARVCTRCDLYKYATQTVFGEGPLDATILFVGEQPGDQEDLAGRPFVGPAGKLFDAALEEAGIDRAQTYVTNAVKHFKFVARGKKRIHSKPDAGEIEACRWWIEQERALIRPPLTVALGATAARSSVGKVVTISKVRGAPADAQRWQRMLGDGPSQLPPPLTRSGVAAARANAPVRRRPQADPRPRGEAGRLAVCPAREGGCGRCRSARRPTGRCRRPCQRASGSPHPCPAAECALPVVADHRLDPEERRDARPAGDRLDTVQRGRGIENHVAGRQLDRMRAVGVLDDQFAAVIIVGIRQEQGRRKVGADTARAIRQDSGWHCRHDCRSHARSLAS